MVNHAKLVSWLIVGGVCAHLSCTLLHLDKSSSPDSSASVPEIVKQQTEAVTVEIFTIRLAPHQNDLVQQLWQEVDEQSLPPQLRRELFTQGFRAGTLNDLLSPALTQLLGTNAGSRPEVSPGDFQEYSMADIAREATVVRKVQNLFPEMRTLIKVFDDQNALPEFALFRMENGMLHGQTYAQALGILCVSAVINKDGSAQIQIVPELEYGTLERRIRSVAGVVMMETNRPRYAFETLTLSQRLLPGQWIIIGATTMDSAGAGKAFFVRKTSTPEQRLVAIRLAQVKHQ